ncbi:MAG TPA: glycosyltransferase family 9 protein [Methylocystis sp.]|nr:glycosyltransferase family 9 protein [Methylocystis sp.]
MRWLKKLPWSKQASRDDAALLLGAFLGRNPDPKNLDYYSALFHKGAGLRKILNEISQNDEYESHFGRRREAGETEGPKVWAGEDFAAYVGEPGIENILVVKLDHIGDFVLALDSFTVLREAFPEAKMTLLCGPWNASLARALGVFARVEALDFFAPTADGSRPPFSRERLGELGDTAFDLAIDLRVDPDTRVVLDHISATFKCGYVSDACRSVLTVGVPRPNFLHSDSLALNQRMMMLSLAHGVVDFFRRDAQWRGASLRRTLAGNAGVDLPFRKGRPLVALHPFSGRAIKNWPLENFLRLAAFLTREMEAAVVLLGSKAEAEGAPGLAARAEEAGARSYVGRTSLEEAIALIAEADLYVGNDSGLTHLAARLGVQSIAIFSGVAPIETWAPFGRDVTIVHAPVACAPCYLPSLELCPNGHKCVAAIDFDYVRALAQRQLASRRATASAR